MSVVFFKAALSTKIKLQSINHFENISYPTEMMIIH